MASTARPVPGTAAELCGVTITLGRSHSGESPGSGSTANTSSPAPPRCPERSASISAGSSTRPPRPTLTKKAPGFMDAMICALKIPWVSSLSGRAETT